MCGPYRLLLLFLHLSIFTCNALADEILGCGGFAKSDIDIDFSQVEVKLFTKQGSLKDHTECAPKNGYYFLPLYDKGEYVLKIQPPAGWSFEPREVNLNVDGVNDECSKGIDINFYFKGFAIIGKVASIGSTVGPKGVTVRLLPESKHDDTVLHETVTAEDGSFLFTPVPPGRYFVRALHPRWKLMKHTVPVELSKGNADVGASSLVVSGYDVSGSVTSDDEPIKGVSFVLFQADESSPPVDIQGCDKSPIPGFKSSGQHLCWVKSDERGQFVFPEVPPGRYKVLPHYAGPHNIRFDVKPTELLFAVGHSSVQISTQFQVKGFSVGGSVLVQPAGKGVAGAAVLLNGRVQAKTLQDGSYHLENMQAGSYTLLVQADDMKFAETVVKVTPNTPQLAPVFPVAFKVCGSVAPHQLPASQPDSLPRSVLLTQVGSAARPIVVETGRGNREFCHFLQPGKYEASVEVTDPEKKRGLVFVPSMLSFEVVDAAVVTGLLFSQLKVQLSGQVQCLLGANCKGLSLTLRSVPTNNPEARMHLATTVTNEGGAYQFLDVLPGQYEIVVGKEDWCWQETSHLLTVGSMPKWTAPTFRQTGYTFNIVSSHNTLIDYRPVGKERAPHRLSVPQGTSRFCVVDPGEYEVSHMGCHGYPQSSLRYSLLSALPLRLTATAHTIGGVVESREKVEDLRVQVFLGEGDELKANLGPLKAQRQSAGGKFTYKFSLEAVEGETLTFVPSAGALLFTPPRQVLVGPSDCTDRALAFSADKGHVIEGDVQPPLAGVKILISARGRDEVIVAMDTGPQGHFKFDPLPGGVEYQIRAEKEGYVLTGPNDKGVISAHKLAEIVVHVVDKADGKPLQGVLLSLSGGDSFRRNSQTALDGRRVFSSLRPGEYYLRPMLKEYRFEPSSRTVSVHEGATVPVKLQGRQVAFSAYGQVTSLNGEPQAGVVVEAVGMGSCQQYQEESSTEPTGMFRVRGLHPQCEYTVRVKQGPLVNENIQRSTPAGIQLKASEGDIHDLRLVVFHPWTQVDVALLVQTSSPEHLRTLKARLCREDSPDMPIHVVKLDQYAGQAPARPAHTTMVTFPPIPLDGRGYFVQLESSLSRATHVYTTYAVHFKANHTFKQLRMVFTPEPRIIDQELNHSSYLALPLLLVGALLWVNQHKLMPLATRIAQAFMPPTGRSMGSGHSSHTVMDHAAADAVMVEPVLNVRNRKAKPRKT